MFVTRGVPSYPEIVRNVLEISKRYSSYKSQPKASNFSWVFFWIVLTKLRLGFLKFWASNLFFFYDFFFRNFKFTIAPYGETKNLNCLENERPYSKMEWNLGLGSRLGYIVQLLEFWQNMAILNIGRYLRNAPRRAKISWILPPWVRKRVYVHLLALWQMAKFLAQI